MSKKIFDNILDVIGNTPMIHLKRISQEFGANIYAKCEFMNPGHSIKDRIALPMVLAAERAGLLKPGYTVVEATAGNTGVSLAMVCASRGYKLKLVVTKKVSVDKIKLLEAYGAEVIIVDYSNSTANPGAFIEYARQLAKQTPNTWYADQFYSKVNLQVHYETTAPEIWEQMTGKIDAFVAGIGTGATFCGVAKFLKEKNPNIQCVLADPVGSIQYDVFYGNKPSAEIYLTEGIGGDFITGITDLKLADCAIKASDKEARQACKNLLDKEHIFVGASAGIILAATKKYCQSLPQSTNIVIVLPDAGKNYLSTFYNPQWCKEKNLMDEVHGCSA